MREHGRSLRSGSADRLSTTTGLQDPDLPTVKIYFPHSSAPDDAPEESRPTEAQVEQARAQGVRRLEAFLASDLARGQTPAWLDTAAFMLGVFHDFKLDHLGGRLEGLRAWQVSMFMSEQVPRSVVADAETVHQLADVFDAYIAWLGATGHEPAAAIARIRARIQRNRAGFEKKALDPAFFSPGKAFAMSALAAGVDMSDRAAVAAHQERYNREHARPGVAGRQRSGPRSIRVDPVAIKKKLEKPRRWFPLEGEALPEPTAPCPCGSGRAFRRCCMPR